MTTVVPVWSCKAAALQHPCDIGAVELAGGLVGQQRRLVRDRRGDGQPLLLATGQDTDRPTPEAWACRRSARVAPAAARGRQPARRMDGRGSAWHWRAAGGCGPGSGPLEVDPATAERDEWAGLRPTREILAVHQHPARGRPFQAPDQCQQRGLAGTRTGPAAPAALLGRRRGQRPAGRRPRGQPAGRSGTGPGRRPGCHAPAASTTPPPPQQLGPGRAPAPPRPATGLRRRAPGPARQRRSAPASRAVAGAAPWRIQELRHRRQGDQRGAQPDGDTGEHPPADEYGVFQRERQPQVPVACAERSRARRARTAAAAASWYRYSMTPPVGQHRRRGRTQHQQQQRGAGGWRQVRRGAARRSGPARSPPPVPPAGRPRRPPQARPPPEMRAPGEAGITPIQEQPVEVHERGVDCPVGPGGARATPVTLSLRSVPMRPHGHEPTDRLAGVL